MNARSDVFADLLARIGRAAASPPFADEGVLASLRDLSDAAFGELADVLCDRFRARDRARRTAAAAASPPDLAGAVVACGTPDELRARLAETELHLVFTAHPSELRPPSVLAAYRDLAPDAPPATIEAALAPLPKVRATPPTVEDEIATAAAFLRATLYPAVLAHARALRAATEARFGLLTAPLPAAFRFAAWAGGDRDGNPAVTAARSREAGRALHATARAELEAIYARVPLARLAPEEREGLLAWRRGLDAPGVDHGAATARLAACAGAYRARAGHVPEIATALFDLHDVFAVFGAHGTALEWRENAEIISRAFAETDGARDCGRAGLSEAVADCLASLRELAALRETCGARAVDALIISNCEDASTVLALTALARACGVFARGPVPIVPLLESIDALRRAVPILAELCADDAFLADARAIGGCEIMVGYSDAAKDGGRLMADHAIRAAQAEIARICAAHGLTPRVFHGRGGSPARGYAELGDIVADADPGLPPRRRKFTEQGEVVADRYGTPRLAERSLGTVLVAALVGSRAEASAPEDAALLARLAEDAYARYSRVRRDPRFLAHLFALTPLATVRGMPLGSRPATRAGAPTLDRLRAIPLNLAANVALLQLPAWFGTGGAWRDLIRREGETAVAAFVGRSLYARLSLERAARALALTDVSEIARRADDPAFAAERDLLLAAADDARALDEVLRALGVVAPVALPRDDEFALLRAAVAAADLERDESQAARPATIRHTLIAAVVAAIGVSG